MAEAGRRGQHDERVLRAGRAAAGRPRAVSESLNFSDAIAVGVDESTKDAA
jgi:hypothetical protein